MIDKTHGYAVGCQGEIDDEDPQADARDAVEDDKSTVVRDGTMQVAGVAAECFLVTVPASAAYEGSSTRYCIKDNVPLYVKSTDANSKSVTEMKATSYKKSVSDSDFVPPVKPSAMPSYDAAGTLPEGYEMPEGFDPSDYAAQ